MSTRIFLDKLMQARLCFSLVFSWPALLSASLLLTPFPCLWYIRCFLLRIVRDCGVLGTSSILECDYEYKKFKSLIKEKQIDQIRSSWLVSSINPNQIAKNPRTLRKSKAYRTWSINSKESGMNNYFFKTPSLNGTLIKI